MFKPCYIKTYKSGELQKKSWDSFSAIGRMFIMSENVGLIE